MILNLLISIAAYILLACSYLGIGWVFSRWLAFDLKGKENVFSGIWLGWAISILFFQIINLFFPINIYTSIPLFVPGMAACIYLLYNQRSFNASKTIMVVFIVLFTGITIWVAGRSMLVPKTYDSGLYHFQSIRWLNEYSIVPGLGNLHGRLAFNQSFFSYVASLNLFPLFNHGHNLANSFLLLVLVAEMLWNGLHYVCRKLIPGKQNPVVGFMAIMLFPAVFFVVGVESISSPVPDFASYILQFFIFLRFIGILATRSDPIRSEMAMKFLLVIAATAITIKLSNLMFVSTIAAVLLIRFWKDWIGAVRNLWKKVIKLAVFPAGILLLWFIRGFVSSGCPLFPSTFGCMPLDWAMPVTAVQRVGEWVFSWARLPGMQPEEVLNSWDWLIPWFDVVFKENKVSSSYPVFVFLLLSVVILLYQVFKKKKQPMPEKWLLLIPVPVIASLLFWFFTAPDLRFAQSLFFLLPLSPLVYLYHLADSTRAGIRWGVPILLFLLVNAGIGWHVSNYSKQMLKISTSGYAPVKQVELIEKKIDTGVIIWLPAKGDQCWDAPIPCTPNVNSSLSLRGRTLRQGFWIPEQTP